MFDVSLLGVSCLRNAVSMFHIIERELQWRREQGRSGFKTMTTYRPTIAVGAQHPISDSLLLADYFRKQWNRVSKPYMLT